MPAGVVAAAPPKPVYTVWPAELVVCPPLPVVVADMVELELVVLTRVGFWAPHGWAVRQFDWHAWAPPQLLTHWLFASVQMK